MSGWYNPNAVEPPEEEDVKIYCPECDHRLYPGDTVYTFRGDIVGCSYCLQKKDWYDYVEELSR